MSDENNDIDRLLQGAFDSRPRGGGNAPSMVDVRSRARRHQRRRVGGVVGATAMLGVSGVAVLASRGTSETGIAGDEATATWTMTDAGPMCGYTQVVPTTMVAFENTTTTLWPDTTVPFEATAATLTDPSGCTPSGRFRCIGNTGTDEQGYTYFEYCEPISDYPPDSTTAAGITDFAPVDSTTTSTELAPATSFLGVDATTTTTT